MELNQDTLDRLYHMFNFVFLDSYLLKNHRKLFRIASRINCSTKDFELPTFEDNIPLEFLIKLEEEFLFSLKPEYMYKFKEDDKNGNIIRLETENIEGIYNRLYPFFNEYYIGFPEKNTIDSLIVLAHEYIHHLSFGFPKRKEETSAYTVYTEMLSKLGELKCLDFLKAYHLVNNEKIELYKKRYRVLLQHVFDSFLFAEPLFNLYLGEEQFKIKQIEKLLEINPYYRILGQETIAKNIISITKKCDIDKLEQDLEQYKYILGLARACHLHQNNISNKEFVNLIERVNIVEVDEFEELLPKASDLELVQAVQKEFTLKK